MEIKFKLLDNAKDIQSKILNAMIPEVDKLFNKAISRIKTQLPNVIRQAITNTPEYTSLLNGQLKYEFGIPNPESKLASLLTVWSTNIVYHYDAPSIIGSKIKASFSANTIRADFSDVLYADFASVVDTKRGYILPWLEWLLLEGNKIIVRKYQIEIGPNKASRTNFAIMKSSRRSWRVPTEFSGTENNNWITRAIDNAESEIQKVVDGAFV